jgi:hypothetical protein
MTYYERIQNVRYRMYGQYEQTRIMFASNMITVGQINKLVEDGKLNSYYRWKIMNS